MKVQQDEYCSRALAHNWHNLGEFPEVLKWEALVDVLRGKVKVRRLCLFKAPYLFIYFPGKRALL